MSQSGKEQEMRSTIARLKQQNSSAAHNRSRAAVKPAAVTKVNRSRVTSDSQRIEPVARADFIRAVTRQIMLGELSQGEALRLLRVEVLGLKQDKYAQLVAVSRKTLSDIENGKGNYSVEVMNKVFRPFGLQMGLVPLSTSLLESLLSDANNPEA